MGRLARLRDWLYRPVAGTVAPAPDELVEVDRFGNRQDADLAVWTLEVNGIKAMAQHNDGHGMAPHYSLMDGHRVLVLARDLERAAAVLRSGGATPGTTPAGGHPRSRRDRGASP